MCVVRGRLHFMTETVCVALLQALLPLFVLMFSLGKEVMLLPCLCHKVLNDGPGKCDPYPLYNTTQS